MPGTRVPGDIPSANLVSKQMSEQKKPNNLRTGLIVGALALFFFVLVFVKRPLIAFFQQMMG